MVMPIIIIVIFVNYFGDAANIFKRDYEKNIANYILKGKNVTNITNYNERLLQKNLINNSSICPEIVVVGASASMLINSSYFKGKTFFNNSVSGGSIEDIIAIIEMYSQKKCFPKKIIIGLQPYVLNKNNNQTRWQTLDLEYQSFINKMSKNPPKKQESSINKINTIIKKNIYYKELLSPSYFQSSIWSLIDGNTNPIITDKTTNKTFTKLADGSIIYDTKYRTASDKIIEEKVSIFLAGNIYGIEHFDALDKDLESKFIYLIEYLSLKNVQVEFYLAPYHPRVYQLISKNEKYKNVLESESFFVNLGFRKNITVRGSFNPNKLHLDKTYFYDGMHLKEKGIATIFNPPHTVASEVSSVKSNLKQLGYN